MAAFKTITVLHKTATVKKALLFDAHQPNSKNNCICRFLYDKQNNFKLLY